MKVIKYHDTDIVRNDGSADTRQRRCAIAASSLWRVETFEDTVAIGATVQNGSDVWQFDYAKRTGYLADSAADSSLLALFGSPEPDVIQKLQLGREVEFFADCAARRIPDDTLGTTVCDAFFMDTVKTQLTFWTNKKTGVPVQIHINSPFKDYKIFYDEYLPRATFDSVAFRVPRRPAAQSAPADSAQSQDSRRTP